MTTARSLPLLEAMPRAHPRETVDLRAINRRLQRRRRIQRFIALLLTPPTHRRPGAFWS